MPWRPRCTPERLHRSGQLWTLTTLAHSVPFLLTGIFVALLSPVTVLIGLILIAHAWIIPELYAARGANVVRVRRRREADAGAEARAVGLLGDLVGHRARELHARTGLVLERGTLGVWLVAEAGALLVLPGGRRVVCHCVRTTDPTLPGGDRIAHLLLALRSDEAGFATIANVAFSGAPWRLRRRLDPPRREALDVAGELARASSRPEPGDPRGRGEVQELCTWGQCPLYPGGRSFPP